MNNEKYEIVKQIQADSKALSFDECTDLQGVLCKFNSIPNLKEKLNGKVEISFKPLDKIGGIEIHYKFENLRTVTQ